MIARLAPKIVFVTNMCTHYSIRLFELLAEACDVDFYFTGGNEPYWEKKNKLCLGKFKGQYLRGFFLWPGFKITLELFTLFWQKTDVVIKTLDDKFALPLIFWMAKIRRKPFILWTGLWHHPETFVHRISRFFTRAVYYYSDAVIVYGQHVKQYLTSLGISEDKIFIAPHAVNNDLFNKEVSTKEKEELKKEIGLPPRKVILYVGRLEDCKGIEYLIEAVKGIKHDLFNIIFIGCGTRKHEFEKKCKERKFNYVFLDYISNEELYRYYAISDIFVLPSITTRDFKEPWGLVINEAMNQGCAVVTTEAVGAAKGGLVEDRKTGFIVPERDSSALQAAIETLLKNERLLTSMKEAARERIKYWSPERMSEGFIEAIDYVSHHRARNCILRTDIGQS